MPLGLSNHLTKSKAIQHVLPFFIPSSSFGQKVVPGDHPLDSSFKNRCQNFTSSHQMSWLNSWQWNLTSWKGFKTWFSHWPPVFALTSYRGARRRAVKFPKLHSGDKGPPCKQQSFTFWRPDTYEVTRKEFSGSASRHIHYPGPLILISWPSQLSLKKCVISDLNKLDTWIRKSTKYSQC